MKEGEEMKNILDKINEGEDLLLFEFIKMNGEVFSLLTQEDLDLTDQTEVTYRSLGDTEYVIKVLYEEDDENEDIQAYINIFNKDLTESIKEIKVNSFDEDNGSIELAIHEGDDLIAVVINTAYIEDIEELLENIKDNPTVNNEADLDYMSLPEFLE